MAQNKRKPRPKASQPQVQKPKRSKLQLPPKIQFARPEDITQLVALGYRSFQENDLGNLGCTPDFNKTIANMTSMVLEHVVLVKRNDKNPDLIDGALVLKFESAWWSSDKSLNTALFYIKPEHRTFKTARALLRAAQEYAIINKLPLVFGIFAQKDVDKKKRLLKYLEFKEVGTLFVFDGR